MNIYVDDDELEFINACLDESKAYDYVASELEYRERIKLKPLSIYRKQICNDIKEKIYQMAFNTNNEKIAQFSLELMDYIVNIVQKDNNEKN